MLRRHDGSDRLDEDLDQLDAFVVDDLDDVVVEDEREVDVATAERINRSVGLRVDQADLAPGCAARNAAIA